ncbi:AMP-binding enzyme [Metarhizium robertsii]|uniref:AMP-binding enzyme n=1 Tax=Metarhizium robertsii TaxID=568076 RepID=A0A0A1URG7_9HYPO|nr:AMP-binding enzyme [Metarhizium robertsii]
MYDDRAIAREELGWIAYNFSRLLSEFVVKQRQTLNGLDIISPQGTKQIAWNRKRQYYSLIMSESTVAVVSMLAMLKAGAAYVPLALDSAKHQLELLRGELDVDMVLCTPHQASKLLKYPVSVAYCTIENLMLEEYSTPPLSKRVSCGFYSRNPYCVRWRLSLLSHIHGRQKPLSDSLESPNIENIVHGRGTLLANPPGAVESQDPNNIGDPFASRAWGVDPEDYSRLAPVGSFISGSTFSWALPGESRFYATGDIVRQNPDGSINYIAKNGHYPMLNGLPVTLKETKYEIEQCEGVISAMVEKFGQSESSTEFLVAFFTLATTTKTGEECRLLDTTDDVQRMIQTAFTRVSERFPLTWFHGSIYRYALFP